MAVKKPKTIGIPGFITENGTSFGAGKAHLQYMQQFGNPRIIMPHEEFVDCDLLYLPGGPDLSPSNYGEIPSFYTTGSDTFREYFFRERLKNYVGKVPIFGICLGFQMLNVFFGGKLTQHLLWHPESPARRTKGHEVRIKTGRTFDVNSHHHQGVLESQVANSFDVIATELINKDVKKEEKYDKVVEAVMHKDLPIAGVQWHPEEWLDEFSEKLINTIMGTL